MELVFRTPCEVHPNCNETAVKVLHRSASEGQPREDEKFCNMCEGTLEKARATLRTKGNWKCPVCGFEHRMEGRVLVPAMSVWHNALKVDKGVK